MTNLPVTIDRSNARLPETYNNARRALAECNRIDECQDWADKAEALASYAKQADDDTLRQMADRIQARAVRRASELLKQYPNGHGGPREQVAATGDLPSQRQAAHAAGMSDRQYRTAKAVGDVPEEVFEAAVESNDPPTVTKLASMGTVPRPGFKKATHLLGAVRRFSEFCAENEPEGVASGVMDSEVGELREMVSHIDGWLDRFVVNLGG
jgi:hypothetical protein